MITDWLDPAMRYFAEQSGIPAGDISSRVGAEGIASGLEFLTDFFSTGWLNAVIQVGAGVIANSYATWGKAVNIRLRQELITMGTHLLFRFVDTISDQVKAAQVRASFHQFLLALQRGDYIGALRTGLVSPAQLQAMFRMAGVPAPAGAPTPTGRPGPFTPAPTPEIRSTTVGPAFGVGPSVRPTNLGATPVGRLSYQEPFGAQYAPGVSGPGRFSVGVQQPYGY